MTDEPLLYYRTKKQIEEYRKLSVAQKCEWLQAQMEFFHKAMPDRAKRIRDRIKQGKM